VDIVLGVSMEPTAVRLVLIEGENADGVTVEEDTFKVVPPAAGGAEGSPTSGPAKQAVAAVIGTREGALDSRYHLASTGLTWTNPADVAALRDELAARDAGSVMLVSPLLAAAALAQTVGHALGYQHIAMLFVEAGSATLAVVDIADGSIVDLHRQPLRNARRGALAAELVTMVAGLDAPTSLADGVFLIGCGVDIVPVKPVLEAATALTVSAPEEPAMALARGAALASANAPLFASSTAALAYALDPGTGEVSPRALSPTYLDVCANADPGQAALAYSAVADDADGDAEDIRRRRSLLFSGSALAGVAAIAFGLLVVSSDVRPTAAQQPAPPQSAIAPAIPLPPQALLPAPPSAPPPAAVPAPEVAPAPVPPPPVANMAPAPTPRRTRQPPVPQAPAQAAPVTTPPAAAPPPPPAPVETAPPTPIATFYLRVPFARIPIPIYPPAPPPPPPPAEPGP
jgi:hypothetical protein